jgi:hypothetical protein
MPLPNCATTRLSNTNNLPYCPVAALLSRSLLFNCDTAFCNRRRGQARRAEGQRETPRAIR